MEPLENYIINNIDRAIEQGWIEAFFQPVVRALTKKLCGVEALARWNDPDWGMLPPALFVKPLEDSQLIYKLDCHIVSIVCSTLDRELKKGNPIVPVSINFSRLDFVKCDIFELVESETSKYDIPRDYIHIEITESIFATDEGFLLDVINKFRRVGYEIWMDDFGSGYSTLNLLKDYDFDMLKMDMNFLTSFTEKSKAIMRSTITMAKEIGIKTLAEGVETVEQFQFLQNIGCEQLQGFYFGRPEKYEDMLEHLKEKRIDIEMRQWRHFYDVAGSSVIDTDIPLEIIEDDGENFHTLFMNRAYIRQVLHDYDIDLSEIDRRIYHTASPLLKKYREFANITENSSNIETFYYTDNGNYLRFRAKCLVKHNGHAIIKGSIMNITMDQNNTERNMLDSKLRDLNLLFEVVDLINIGDNLVAPLLGRFKYINNDSYVNSDLKSIIQIFANDVVYSAEKNDFTDFMNLSTLPKRVEESSKGYIEKIFRIKQSDGSYRRKNVIVMSVPGTGGNEFLVCYKSIPMEVSRVLDGLTASARLLVDKYLADSGAITYSELWDNIIWASSVKFFWKDKNRRFLGASQSFLDYYGFKSIEEIVGKTDEDMGWHIDGESYKSDEEDVLNEGKMIIDAQGQCIVSGVVHDIVCQKMPVYRNGEIIGLIGFFQDKEEELYRLENIAIPNNIDPLTKLMNAKAFMLCLLDYAGEYLDKGKNYGLIIVRNASYSRVLSTYGKDTAEKSLVRMCQKITEVVGRNCAVGRIKESYFGILTFIKTREALDYLAKQIKEAIETIIEIDGNSITINAKIATALRSDENVTDEKIYEIVISNL